MPGPFSMPDLSSLTNGMGSQISTISSHMSDSCSLFGTMRGGMFGDLLHDISMAAQTALNTIMENLAAIKKVALDAISSITSLVSQALSGIGSLTMDAISAISSALSGLQGNISSFISGAMADINSALDAVKAGLISMAGVIKDAVSFVIASLCHLAQDAFGTIPAGVDPTVDNLASYATNQTLPPSMIDNATSAIGSVSSASTSATALIGAHQTTLTGYFNSTSSTISGLLP